MKKLVDLMAKHNLQNSALSKSFSATLNPKKAEPETPVELPPLDDIIIRMLRHPLPGIDSTQVKKVLAIFSELESKMPPDVKEFYKKHIAKTMEECISIFQATIPQSKCDDWFKFRKYLITASIARLINYARNETTRYAHFTR